MEQKIIISQNEPGIQNLDSQVETYRNGIQKVYDEFIKLNIGDMSIADINQVTNDPKGFYNARINEIVEVPEDNGTGFKPKKSAFIATLDLPDPSVFIERAKSLQDKYRENNAKFVSLTDFVIKDGKVDIDPNVYDRVSSSFIRYANTDDDIQNYKTLTDIANKLNELNPSRQFDIWRFFTKGGDGVTVDEYIKVNPAFFNKRR